MDENHIKHLEFIQNIITRMNTNSFQIKGMTITILSALIAVYVADKNAEFILVSLLPLILFWFLDSYYLMQERKFRGLYNDLVNDDNESKLKPFEMNISSYTKKMYSFRAVFFSKTIITFYGILIVLMIGFYIFLNIYSCIEEKSLTFTQIM